MKNLAINFFVAILFAIHALAQNQKTNFIAFNGGASELDNRSYYEDYILFFRNNFFKDSTTVLNANGKSSKVIPFDQYGYIDRTWLGNVNYQPTAIADSQKASKENLTASISQVAKTKPQAVTLFFTDHGSPEGVAAWNEIIDYQSIKSVDNQFDPNTVVRRIHFHCFAGGAIQGKSNQNTTDLLAMYPKNRCAFAASREDEFAYGFNFAESEGLKKSLDQWKNKKTAPSLTDLKNLLQGLDSYSATPQLTSNYFMQDLSEKLCFLLKLKL